MTTNNETSAAGDAAALAPTMRLRIESALARAWNQQLEDEQDEKRPNATILQRQPRAEAWEGDVPQMTLEEIFRFFNRVDEGDSERLAALGYDLPSLSVGDSVTIPDTGLSYRVDPVGFRRLT